MNWILNFLVWNKLKKQNETIIELAKEIQRLKKQTQRVIIWKIDKYTEVDEDDLRKTWAIDNILKSLAYEIHINSDSIRWHLWEMSTDEKIWWANCLHYLYVKYIRIKEWQKKEETYDDE
jgi:hypothetical protein